MTNKEKPKANAPKHSKRHGKPTALKPVVNYQPPIEHEPDIPEYLGRLADKVQNSIMLMSSIKETTSLQVQLLSALLADAKLIMPKRSSNSLTVVKPTKA